MAYEPIFEIKEEEKKERDQDLAEQDSLEKLAEIEKMKPVDPEGEDLELLFIFNWIF